MINDELQLLFYLAIFLASLFCCFFPACALAHKLGQCLPGRLPPDELADAEPIRFDATRLTRGDLVSRPQFSLKTVFWLMAMVATFFGGMAWQRSMCEVFEEDVADLREQLYDHSKEMERLYEKIKWQRRQLIKLDPKFDVPDDDARSAPSGGHMNG